MNHLIELAETEELGQASQVTTCRGRRDSRAPETRLQSVDTPCAPLRVAMRLRTVVGVNSVVHKSDSRTRLAPALEAARSARCSRRRCARVMHFKPRVEPKS